MNSKHISMTFSCSYEEPHGGISVQCDNPQVRMEPISQPEDERRSHIRAALLFPLPVSVVRYPPDLRPFRKGNYDSPLQ